MVEASVGKIKTAAGPSVFNLLRNRSFFFLWISGALSSAALTIYLLTESWYVVSGLHRQDLLGIVMMLTMIPRVILMLFGGVVSDRVKKSYILFLSDFIRGLLVTLIAVLIFMSAMNIWYLLLFAFCFGALDAFFWPASRSLLPSLVKKNQITKANSLIQGANQLLTMVGPAIAGFAIHLIHFQGTFLLTGLLLLGGSLINLLIREQENIKRVQKSALAEIKETWVYAKKQPYILNVMTNSIIINFFLVGPITVGLPLLVKNVLKGSAMDLGYMESGIAVGMLIGAIIMGSITYRKKRAVTSLFVIGALALLNASLGWMSSIWFGLIILGIMGILLSISNIISPSLTQEMVEEAYLGRVMSMMSTASIGFTPLSFAAVSVLISVGVPISWIIIVSSLVLALYTFTVVIKAKFLWAID